MFAVTALSVIQYAWDPATCERHVTGVNNTGIGTVGELVIIQNVTRYCDDIYECIASNGVPPTVSRQMRVTVECKLSACALASE